METIIEFISYAFITIITSPYKPIRYLADKKYRQRIREEKGNNKIGIFLFLFKDVLILLGLIIFIVVLILVL
jgi:hypothetical protein